MKKVIKRSAKKILPDKAVRELARGRRLEEMVEDLRGRSEHLQKQVDAMLAERDSRLERLKKAVKSVEPYQPLYGVAGIIDAPARPSKDRGVAIERYLEGVRGKRILDIGSSLGYLSFFLADRGAVVEGWEYNAKNVEVANLTKAINGIPVKFLTKEFNPENVATITDTQFDVAIVLSVFHHIIYYHDLEYTQRLVADLLMKVPVLIVELARKGEDSKLPWDRAQPDDELAIFDLVKDKVSIRQIGEFGNHLSSNRRPLYAVSLKQTVTVNGHAYSFERKTAEAYAGSPVASGHSQRRYYFAKDYVVKEYVFNDPERKVEWRTIVNELNVLDNLLADKDVYHLPRLVDHELTNHGAKLVVRRTAGNLLADEPALSPGRVRKIASDILKTLADLRANGLYHNDVRSWNIIVTAAGAWLIDYGWAAPLSTDDDILSLLWALQAALSGVREHYEIGKQHLPPPVLFKEPALKALYAAVKKGERDPATLQAVVKD